MMLWVILKVLLLFHFYVSFFKAFDVVKKKMTVEEILSKLDVVSGDCEQLNLGMSEEDRQKVSDNVTLFYHFAATIRFDEKMKKAVEMNVRGTREVIKLALECKNLEMFGHMSTSYCHLHVPYLLEKVWEIIICKGWKLFIKYLKFPSLAFLKAANLSNFNFLLTISIYTRYSHTIHQLIRMRLSNLSKVCQTKILKRIPRKF